MQLFCLLFCNYSKQLYYSQHKCFLCFAAACFSLHSLHYGINLSGTQFLIDFRSVSAVKKGRFLKSFLRKRPFPTIISSSPRVFLRRSSVHQFLPIGYLPAYLLLHSLCHDKQYNIFHGQKANCYVLFLP